MITPKPHIFVLYIDSEETNLKYFESVFGKHFRTFLAPGYQKAKQLLSEYPISVILIEQRAEELERSRLLIKAVGDFSDQTRILISDKGDVKTINSAFEEGFIFKFLERPWDPAFISETIESAYQLYLRKAEMLKKEKELTDIKFKLERALENVLREKVGVYDDPSQW